MADKAETSALLAATGSHWQPLALLTLLTLCAQSTMQQPPLPFSVFHATCKGSRSSGHMNSARVSTSSEEVRNFNKQNKYATSWAPFKTTPVPLPMARDRSWQKSCSSRSTYRVHIGSVCTAFDSFHHSSQPGVLCPLFAFATFFPSFFFSISKATTHIDT